MSSSRYQAAAAHITVFAGVLALWQLAAMSTTRLFLPSPTTVLSTLYNDVVAGGAPWLGQAVALTVTEIAIGFLVATALGLAIGFALAYNKTLGLALIPLVLAVVAIPHVIFFPVTIAVFGLGLPSKVAYGVLAGSPVIALGIMVAVTEADRAAIATARSLGAGEFTVFTRVIIPSSASSIIGALRVGFGVVVVATLISEVLGSLDGLGFYLRTTYETFRTPQYFALMVVVMVLAVGLNLVALAAERSAKSWLHA